MKAYTNSLAIIFTLVVIATVFIIPACGEEDNGAIPDNPTHIENNLPPLNQELLEILNSVPSLPQADDEKNERQVGSVTTTERDEIMNNVQTMSWAY